MSVSNSRLIGLCDGKLQTEDGYTFGIHRHMLARKSQYFCSMFCGINEDRREFVVPGISGSCLTEILLYIYTDKPFVTEQNLAELLKGADYLLMKNLILQIKKSFMKYLTISNCLEVFNTAYLISDEELFQKCFRFIVTRYEEIINNQMEDLTELPLELLEKILSSKSLKVYSETTAWLSIVEWLQKDISTRLVCFPRLAMCLAGLELDEKLATEILQHEIVSSNFRNESQEIKDSLGFSSNLDTVMYFLDNCSSFSENPRWSRIPSQIQVITLRIDGDDFCKYDIYMTYDENLDLWRKVGEIRDSFIQSLIVVGHKLFLFGNRTSKQFDIISQQWIPMSNLRNICFIDSILDIEGYIYVFGDFYSQGENFSLQFGMAVYNIQNNRWLNSVLLSNIRNAVSVTINKKIYAVGNTQNWGEMTTQMFDTVTQHWTNLPPPNVFRKCFALLAHRDKVYMIGGYEGEEMKKNVEMFDPKTNLWCDLPHLPNTNYYVAAFVLNDHIFVSCFNKNDNRDIFRWNEAEERWEWLEATDSFRNLIQTHLFSTVKDVSALREITKQSRHQRTNLQRSPFFYRKLENQR